MFWACAACRAYGPDRGAAAWVCASLAGLFDGLGMKAWTMRAAGLPGVGITICGIPLTTFAKFQWSSVLGLIPYPMSTNRYYIDSNMLAMIGKPLDQPQQRRWAAIKVGVRLDQKRYLALRVVAPTRSLRSPANFMSCDSY